MAMFSSPRRDGDPAPTRRSSGNDARLSVLAAGTHIVGEIEADGVVKIEGCVEGSLRAEGQVLVAKGGVVKGDIATRQAIIAGEVQGEIFADERVELQPGSVVDGDITTPQIIIEEGGKVNGHIKMANPQAVTQPGKPSRSATDSARAPASHGTRELSPLKPTGSGPAGANGPAAADRVLSGSLGAEKVTPGRSS